MMASEVNSPEGLLALLVKYRESEPRRENAPTLTGQLMWHSLTDGEIRSQEVEFFLKENS